tara:strand:- start:1714 stop:2226 length:513 start_codon:yes stop_codon:yes gene_type:complete
MKSSKNIVFLGMMGSGKTSIGFLVSKKLKLDFFDIDKQIEDELGMKISNIFDNKGEKFFRDYEEKTSLDILKKKNVIIALGGGAFINKNIRNEVIKNHLSFWLKLKSDILIKRIKNSAKRPLAINSSNNDLKNMIKERSKFYSKAMFNIDCNNKSKSEIVNKIINIYEDN